MRLTDVVVIGGGSIGLASAIALAADREHPSGHEHEVEGPVADGRVGNADISALRVANLGNSHESKSQARLTPKASAKAARAPAPATEVSITATQSPSRYFKPTPGLEPAPFITSYGRLSRRAIASHSRPLCSAESPD
jgi:hypothetical protein